MNHSPSPSEPPPFWEDPEQVAQFAARDPDLRLVELMKEYAEPGTVRVLDLGCAGGRNTEPLVRAGFDVTAVDASAAMVAETRRRVAALRGEAEARRRVFVTRMDDLGFAARDDFALVVALGVYQQAQGEEEFRRALAETARVLAPGGRCLVANFAPGTGPRVNPPELVPGTSFVFDGFRYGHACLLPAELLDHEFARVGFVPAVPSRTVDRSQEDQGRITVNALYRKERG